MPILYGDTPPCDTPKGYLLDFEVSGLGGRVTTYTYLYPGPLLNYDYRLVARKHNVTIDGEAGDNIDNFPIEEVPRL